MLTRQGKILIAMTGGLLVVVLAVVGWRSLSRHQDDLALAKQQLASGDPGVQLAGAQRILAYDPDHIQAGLVRARAMYRLGRYRDCHLQLDHLPNELSPDEGYEAAWLGAQSLIQMTRRSIENAPPHGLDAISAHVAELLAQAASCRHILAADGREPITPLIIRAMEVDTRAMYLRRAMSSMATQLQQTRSALEGQEVQALGVQTSDDQLKLNMLDQELNDLCQQALRIDALAVQPRMMLIRRHLRRGELDAASFEVDRLLNRPRMPVDQAVHLAMELLHLERFYNLETSPRQVALAQQLLARVSPDDAHDLGFQQALAVLKLRRGDYQGARDLLQKVLSHPQYAGRHEGICLMGRILIGLGEADQAFNLLARLNDRSPTWESKYVQGLAMIAQGQPGLDLLRQAQELEPRSLELGLSVCQTIVDNAGYAAAELDIARLAEIAPMHRRVMELRLMMAATLGRRPIIDQYMHATFASGRVKMTLADTLVLAHMALDDVQGVKAIAQAEAGSQGQQDSPADAPAAQAVAGMVLHDVQRDDGRLNPIMILAAGWDRLAPSVRAETARYLADAMAGMAMSEPLQAAAEPSLDAWRRYQHMRAQAMFSEDAQAVSHEIILRHSQFLPWPLERISDLLAAARRTADPGRTQAMQERLLSLSARVALWLGDEDQARAHLQAMSPSALSPLDQAMLACLDDDKAAYESLVAKQAGKLAGQMARADPTWQLLELVNALKADDMTAAVLKVDGLLKAHPNLEPALLWLVRHLYAQQRFDALDHALEKLYPAAPEFVQIAQSRVLIARNMVRSSRKTLSISSAAMLSDTMARWQQTEIEALYAALHDQSLVAMGLLETLGLSIRTQAQAIGLGQVDLMTIMGRANTAASIILQQLADPTLDPSLADGYLARGLVLIEPQRLLDSLDRAMQDRPKLPVFHYYKARLLQNMKQHSQALASLRDLLALRPDAPRTRMLQARLAMDQGQVGQAQALLLALQAEGGENASVASHYLLQLAGPSHGVHGTTGAAPQAVEVTP